MRALFSTRKPWFTIAAAITLAVALRLVWALAPAIAGVDFYAYACFARDLVSPQGASAARFAYFPGVYVFWAAVMKLWGQSLHELQQGYVALLVTNAALCAALVIRALGRLTRPLTLRARLLAGVFAFAWCLLLDVPLEGFVGATEPIATVPFLLGLLVWCGAPLVGRAGLVRALALGLGIGLGVFGKQQALLVAFGWLALVPDALGAFGASRASDSSARKPVHEKGALFAIPVAALVALLAALQLSGGLSALLRGVQTAQTYGVQGSRAPSQLPLVFGLAGALAAVSLVTFALRSLPRDPAVTLATFLLVGGLAALSQLAVRPYKHYALLAVPMVAAGAVILLARAFASETASTRSPPTPRRGSVELAAPLAALLALPLFLWLCIDVPLGSLTARAPMTEWPAGTSAQQDLEAIHQQLAPGSALIVLPPRRAAAQFILGTRADTWPLGYFWGPPDPSLAPRSVAQPQAHAVLSIAPRDEYDANARKDFGADEAEALLPSLGYSRAFSSPAMTLWTRP